METFLMIIQHISPVTFKIKNQLDGKITKAHKELLRLAKIDEWDIPKDDNGRPLRKAAYAAAPESESDTESEEQNANINPPDVEQQRPGDDSDAVSVDSEQGSVMSQSNYGSSDEEDNIALAQLAQKYRRKREHSSSEEDNPLWELSKRLKSRDDPEVMPSSDAHSELSNDGGGSLMDINECCVSRKNVRKSRKDKLYRIKT